MIDISSVGHCVPYIVGHSLNQGVWICWYGIQMKCRSIFHWMWPTPEHSAVKSHFEGIWVLVSLRSEITMVTCKQLTMLWCRAIWIFNSDSKDFWAQSSTCEVGAWVKMELTTPRDWRECFAFQFSKTLTRAIFVRSHRIYQIETHNECTIKSW